MKELCGVYIADDDIAYEVVTLRPDGTYVQRVRIKGSTDVALSEGRWVHERSKGYVVFLGGFMLARRFPHKLNPDYARPPRGNVWKPAKYWFGCLVLGTSEGVEYKKAK